MIERILYKKQKPENHEYFFGKKYSYEINNLFAIRDNRDDEFQNIFPFEHSNFHEIISYRCKFFGNVPVFLEKTLF